MADDFTPDSHDDFTPDQSFGNALREYGHKMNPVAMAQGIAENVMHPGEAIKRWGQVNNKILSNAEDAYKRGDYTEAAAHTLYYVLNGVPGLGEALDEAGTKLRNGDVAGGLADTAALGTQVAAGIKAPAIAEAAPTIAKGTAGAVKGGFQGGIEPVKYGHLRLPLPASAAAAAAGHYVGNMVGMPEAGAVAGAAYPVVRGAIKGYKAAVAEAPKAAPSAASSAASAAAAPAAEEAAAPKAPGQAMAEADGQTWSKLGQDDKLSYAHLEGAQESTAARNPAPPPYVPRTPADYGVKAAEVPPQPAPSAPAPTIASAAATAKVQPIRTEPAYHATRSVENAEGILKKGTIYPAGDPGNETGFVSATTQPSKNYANAPVYFELDPTKTPLEPFDYFAGKPKTVNGETVPGYEGGPNDPRFEHEVRAQGAVPTSSVKAIHINPSVSADDVQGLKASAAQAGIPVIEDSPAFGAKAPTSSPTTPKPASGATAAKSARYADAIGKWARDHGMSVKQIADQWENASPEAKGQIYIELQRQGYLGANETIPNTSAPGIISALKAKAATIKPPAGFSMGSMGTKAPSAAPSAVATAEPPAATPAEAPAPQATTPAFTGQRLVPYKDLWKTPLRQAAGEPQPLIPVKEQVFMPEEFKRGQQYQYLHNEHFFAVRDALEAGKHVPPEVLADYPNLSR